MSITHQRTVELALGGLAAAALVAAVATPTGASTDDGAALHASAAIVDAAGTEIGFAQFVEDADGLVHVNVKVSGLTPGLHGLHVHANGACTPDFSAAGAHHNPLGASHGDPHGSSGSHSGDMPNMTVNAAGEGRLNAQAEGITVSAGTLTMFDGNGSALVIHALEDDFVTQPTGNSGARVACGVITSG